MKNMLGKKAHFLYIRLRIFKKNELKVTYYTLIAGAE
jgi:hypothetical protein